MAEKSLISDALKKSEEFHIEQAMLDDKLKATDWEATNEEIMELVARESYLQWIKDNENRNNPRTTYLNLNQITSSNSNAATCSSWDNTNQHAASLNSPKKHHNHHHHHHNNNHHHHHSRTSSRRSSTSTPPSPPSTSKLSNQSTKSNESKSKKQPQHFDDVNYLMQQNDKLNANQMTTINHQLINNNNNKNNTQINFSNNSDDNENVSMQYQYDYDTNGIMNKLSDPRLFGLTSNDDWATGIDDMGGSNNDSDILARVLAASQQEYLESLKAKRQQQQQGGQ